MTTHEFCLLGDVARQLHCKPHQIVYLLAAGYVPEPMLRLGGRRVFTPVDVERIASRLESIKQRRQDERE